MTSDTPPRWSTLPQNSGDKFKVYAYAPILEYQDDNSLSLDITSVQTDIIAAASAPIDVTTSSPEVTGSFCRVP